MAIRIVEAILLAMFLSVLGFMFGRMIGGIVQRSMEEGANLTNLRDIVTRRAKLERALESRVRTRRAELRQMENRIKELVRQRLDLEAQLREALAIKDLVVRVVGEEIIGRPRYSALVFNKYVASGAISGSHALIDSSWGIPQAIDVWAPGMGEARAELEKRYPPSFGYVVSRLTVASVDREAGSTED
jgi:hypothetical protein